MFETCTVETVTLKGIPPEVISVAREAPMEVASVKSEPAPEVISVANEAPREVASVSSEPPAICPE